MKSWPAGGWTIHGKGSPEYHTGRFPGTPVTADVIQRAVEQTLAVLAVPAAQFVTLRDGRPAVAALAGAAGPDVVPALAPAASGEWVVAPDLGEGPVRAALGVPVPGGCGGLCALSDVPREWTSQALAVAEVVAQKLAAQQALDRAEHRHQRAADAAGVGTFSLAASGEVVFSPQAARLLGLAEGEPSFEAFMGVVPAEDRRAVGRAIARAQDPRSPRRLDVEHRAVSPATGEVRWLAVRAESMLDGDGRLAALDGVLVDVTDLKRSEQAAARERALYQAVLDQVGAETAVLDRDGRYVYVSPTAVRDAETRRWLVGRTDADYVRRRGLDPSVAVRRRETVSAVVASGAPVENEETIVDRRGRTRHLLRIMEPVRDPEGRVTHVAGRTVDLTDVREAEAGLRAAVRTREALLDNMSHEVRTPLTAVIGGAQILADDLDGEDAEVARRIERGGTRLLRVLDAVLDAARLAGGRSSLALGPVDLSAVVARVAEQAAPDAHAKGLAFTAEPDGPALAVAQPDALVRALGHLVDNAIKFTERGAVDVRAWAAGDDVCVRVTDTGVGIAPGQLADLFEPFAQGSTGRSRSHEGLGLGLTVARGLVTEMDGRVEVESAVGEGTAVTVCLPRADGDG